MLFLVLLLIVKTTNSLCGVSWSNQILTLTCSLNSASQAQALQVVSQGKILKKIITEMSWKEEGGIDVAIQYKTKIQHQYLLVHNQNIFPLDLFFDRESFFINSIYKKQVESSAMLRDNRNPSRFGNDNSSIFLDYLVRILNKSITVVEDTQFSFDGETVKLGCGFLRVTESLVSYYDEDGFSYPIHTQNCIIIGWVEDAFLASGACHNSSNSIMSYGFSLNFFNQDLNRSQQYMKIRIRHQIEDKKASVISFLGSSGISIDRLQKYNKAILESRTDDGKHYTQLILIQEQGKKIEVLGMILINLFTSFKIKKVLFKNQNKLGLRFYQNVSELFYVIAIKNRFFRLLYVNIFYHLKETEYDKQKKLLVEILQNNEERMIWVFLGNSLEFENKKYCKRNCLIIERKMLEDGGIIWFDEGSYLENHYRLVKVWKESIQETWKTTLKKDQSLIRRTLRLFVKPTTNYQTGLSLFIFFQLMIILLLVYRLKSQRKLVYAEIPQLQ